VSSPTYTFDASLSTPKDWVRWRSGDVSGDPQWFTADNTINALLATYSQDEVAAQCAESIGSQCIQLAKMVVQRHLQLEYGDRAREAFALADRIRQQAESTPDMPPQTGAQYASISEPVLDEYLLIRDLEGL